MDPALRTSYETCRRLHRRYDPTYYWATRGLPATVRPATHALYGYVRTADEIVDGPGRAPDPGSRRAALDAWEAALDRGLDAGGSAHPVIGALVDAATRHRLPLSELKTYMVSMRVDCAPVRIESGERLDAYMDGSAGSVGRIMAPLLGVPARHHADLGRLGLAFQLTNFIRDVREDRRLDRVYLPADRLAAHGVAEADLDRPSATPALRALVGEEVRRARALFAAAEPAVAAAPRSVRPGIRFACAGYLRVLAQVERVDGDVLGHRIGLRAWDLPRMVAATRRG
jgi:15-cis-phytoene synthase